MSGVTLAQVILRDTASNRPAAGTAGRLFFDTTNSKMQRDSGDAWEDCEGEGGAGGLVPITPPPALSTLTWVNQESASAEEINGGIYLHVPAFSGEHARLLVKSLPTPPYTITVGFIPQVFAPDHHAGIAIRESGTGKFIAFFLLATNIKYHITSYSSPTAGVTDYFDTPFPGFSNFVYLQISDDNAGNRIYRESLDGFHFVELFRHASNTYFTPDQWGIASSSNNGTYPCGMTLYHFLEE